MIACGSFIVTEVGRLIAVQHWYGDWMVVSIPGGAEGLDPSVLSD